MLEALRVPFLRPFPYIIKTRFAAVWTLFWVWMVTDYVVTKVIIEPAFPSLATPGCEIS